MILKRRVLKSGRRITQMRPHIVISRPYARDILVKKMEFKCLLKYFLQCIRRRLSAGFRRSECAQRVTSGLNAHGWAVRHKWLVRRKKILSENIEATCQRRRATMSLKRKRETLIPPVAMQSSTTCVAAWVRVRIASTLPDMIDTCGKLLPDSRSANDHNHPDAGSPACASLHRGGGSGA